MSLHQQLVMKRRVSRLSSLLGEILRETGGKTCLDVGCGSGEMAVALMAQCPGLEIEGVDVLVRPGTHIPVKAFDGLTLPYEDNSMDMVILVDVLHHTEQQQILLNECARVARQVVLIKDHVCENPWDHLRLRFMDWVGNRSHGVALPYLYLSRVQWQALWENAGLDLISEKTRLNLYPVPAHWVFDGNLHLISCLRPR